MKTFRLLTIVSATAAISLLFSQASLAQIPVVQVSRNLQAPPLILNGKSGGSVASNCGNITSKPSQVIEVTESLPYLRVTVESSGKPTLLIDGPGGRFCVMSDNYAESQPEMSGYWQPGTYYLYVGESSVNQYNYKLSISQRK